MQPTPSAPPKLQIGLGDPDFSIGVYIANCPPMLTLQGLNSIEPLLPSEIYEIGQACGNGWRKVFNVYAKFLFALDAGSFGFSQQAASWQAYRDGFLLQQGSKTALLFSPPDLEKNAVHIICGRTHANAMIASGALDCELVCLDQEFAVGNEFGVSHEFGIKIGAKLIVCPFFDYRQLSNIKIERLARLVEGLTS